MVNPFFSPGEQRAAKVQELFARIAPRYDLINDIQSFGLHRHWKRRLVRLAAPRPGQTALDLCCGTGDLAFALCRQGAETTGLDFSEPMLDYARKRAGNTPGREGGSEPNTPRFIRGDAQQLPFGDNRFDIITVSYGLRNLADWKLGVDEMQRVLKPGGRLLVLDFGKPDNAVWRRFYFGYLRLFVPLLGRLFCGSFSAYAYILESLQQYPAQHGVAAKMSELGFERVRIVNLLGGVMTINYGEKKAGASAA